MSIAPAFQQAVEAFAADDVARAAELARAAAASDPASRLYPAAAEYLGRVAAEGKAGVYVSGAAFGAFIRGGGNLPLYANTSAALARAYADQAEISLLDIGVGDGLALLPALSERVTRVDLVEPSAALLAQTTAALERRGMAYRAFPGTVQAFAARVEARWDVAQATFSLQSLRPAERRTVLGWLRGRAGRLLVAEFDVPELGVAAEPARVAHFARRYELGLAEYPDDDTVAQGFLMPVFFGYFDPGAARTNFEQPIAAWEQELRGAGFAQIERRPLYDYWWAPAYLLDARSANQTLPG